MRSAPRFWCRTALGLVTAVVAAWAPAAWAHGEVFEVLGAVSVRGDGAPSVIRTSIGLAYRAGDGRFRYGCPSRFADDTLALAAADAEGQRVAVIGAGRLFASMDTGCSYTELDLPEGVDATNVAWSGDAAWVVTTAPALHRVVFDGDAPAASLVADLGDHAPTSLLASSNGVLVAGAAPAPWVRVYRQDGTFDALTVAPGDLDITVLTLTEADGLWASAKVGNRTYVLRSDGGELTPVSGPWGQVLGPVRTATGETVAVLDYRDAVWVEADGAFDRDGPSDWSCLTVGSEAAFGCAFDELDRLDAGAPTRVFGLELLDGPSAGCPGGLPRADVCWFDWFHYGNEVGLAIPPEDPDPPQVVAPPTKPGGCATGGTTAPVLIVLVSLAIGRRLGRSRRLRPYSGP